MTMREIYYTVHWLLRKEFPEEVSFNLRVEGQGRISQVKNLGWGWKHVREKKLQTETAWTKP